MFSRSLSTSAFFLTTALVATMAVAVSPADAQVKKPFKIRGIGVGPEGIPVPGQPARPHWIAGNATHLGRHDGRGAVKTDSADFSELPDRITGEFGSDPATPFTFVGANGDRLVCHYGRTEFGADEPGFFDLTVLDILEDGNLVVEALWIAEFVPVSAECTGKFKGVKGSWLMFAYSEPFVLGSSDPVVYGWDGEGTLLFKKQAKSKRRRTRRR